MVKSFVRGIKREIREHVILQQPPDFESALNIAKLKELVTLSRKSKRKRKRKSNNLSGTNLTFGVQISKIMKIVVLIANFDLANLIVFVTGD